MCFVQKRQRNEDIARVSAVPSREEEECEPVVEEGIAYDEWQFDDGELNDDNVEETEFQDIETEEVDTGKLLKLL